MKIKAIIVALLFLASLSISGCNFSSSSDSGFGGSFASLGGGGGGGGIVHHVNPEPSTIILFGISLLGLFGLKKFRNKK